jgi:23S rRNA pseudouridine2605 synthase
VVASLGDSADVATDEITLDGSVIVAQAPAYWLLYKPRGIITTTRDTHGRSTVLDLLPLEARKQRLFPVGRLDRDSEGLLLLTNDGEVAQAMLHPSLGCEKEYRVTVRGHVSRTVSRLLAEETELEDGPMRPRRIGASRYDAGADTSTFHLTLLEGRKRQIRRAMAAHGHAVLRLVRIRMGPLRLGHLKPGQARRLTRAEQRALPRASLRRTRQRRG